MLPVTAIGSDGSMTHESCLVTFPGSAAGAAALKSGRRRPSVVTEGYIRLPPLPPTTSYLPLPDSGSPPVHDYTCNLQCILRAVFKKHRFFTVFCGLGRLRVSSWRRQKTMGFSWFWVLGRGPERKTGHLDGFGVNIGPTSAKMWATWVHVRLR